MMLDKAVDLLEGVIQQKTWIPYKRHRGERGHHPGIRRWDAGGHPVNASRSILRVLKNAESNADSKGLDIDRLKIIHAAAEHGRKYKAFIERAFGRSSAFYETTTHIEIVLEEVA
jgi:large subunit ribosomal protein L22